MFFEDDSQCVCVAVGSVRLNFHVRMPLHTCRSRNLGLGGLLQACDSISEALIELLQACDSISEALIELLQACDSISKGLAGLLHICNGKENGILVPNRLCPDMDARFRAYCGSRAGIWTLVSGHMEACGRTIIPPRS